MYALKIPNFNLQHIYDSLQDISIRRIFGFERHGFMFFVKDKMLKVEQIDDRCLFSCTDNDFYDMWFDFFDLSTDYSELNGIARKSRSDISIVARQGHGLHLLRQDPFECLLKEVLFDGRSPKQARESLELVCEASTEQRGKTLKGYGHLRWHPLPDPDQLESSLELLDWFCDSETVNRCVSIVEWSKCHRELLVNPEGHSEDEVNTELLKLGLSQHKVDRIKAYGWHIHSVDVTSKKQERLIERQTGVDVKTLVEFEFGDYAAKAAYAGTLLARDQAVKNRKGK